MTYENCYSLLQDVRRDLDEYSDLLVKGLDSSGRYKNSQIVTKINSAQRYIYNLLFPRIPEEFLESAPITGVDAVYDLPWDFGILKEFRDENGHKVHRIGVQHLKSDATTGSDSLYYKKGNTLVLDKDGVTETYTLWYYKKCRDLDQGKASDGGAASIALATTAKKIADYYNGMILENITQDWVDTIDDYTAARVATISETAVASDYYGLVSSLPEPFHALIAPRASLEIRAFSPERQERPTDTEFVMFNGQLLETLRAYAGNAQDITPENIWCNYGGRGGGVNIPGQGYTIF
ncbi:hypothetical protein KAX97_11880 [candidate division WOR-3 bacterium]|nr:hypothetical protein [candidate division WOR-3 bacterium]